jgi:hypothetical protein
LQVVWLGWLGRWCLSSVISMNISYSNIFSRYSPSAIVKMVVLYQDNHWIR